SFMPWAEVDLWSYHEGGIGSYDHRLLTGFDKGFSLYSGGTFLALFLVLLAAGSSHPIRVWQPAVLLCGGAIVGVIIAMYVPEVILAQGRGSVEIIGVTPHAGLIITLAAALSLLALGALQVRWIQHSGRGAFPTTASDA